LCCLPEKWQLHSLWNTLEWTNHKRKGQQGRWWLMPVILSTQEAEIRKITVWSQPKQITLSRK
jgi:hypothetical protein